MRKLILINIILFPFYSIISAQEITDKIDNFTVEDSKVVWQKVYETDLNFKELTDRVYITGTINNPDIRDEKIIGKTYHFDTHFRETGASWGFTPIFLQHKISAYAIIEYREGRYRVTLKDITTHMEGEIQALASNNETKLEEYVVKNRDSKFRPIFEKKVLTILEHAFSKEFDFNKTTIIENEEW